MTEQRRPGQLQTGRLVGGLVFILLGVVFLLQALGIWDWNLDWVADAWVWVGPILLVVAGVAVLLSANRGR